MEAPQMRGVEEPLLPEPRAVEGGATQSEGAIETQEARYPRLHKTAGLRSLDVWVEISNGSLLQRRSLGEEHGGAWGDLPCAHTLVRGTVHDTHDRVLHGRQDLLERQGDHIRRISHGHQPTRSRGRESDDPTRRETRFAR